MNTSKVLSVEESGDKVYLRIDAQSRNEAIEAAAEWVVQAKRLELGLHAIERIDPLARPLWTVALIDEDEPVLVVKAQAQTMYLIPQPEEAQ